MAEVQNDPTVVRAEALSGENELGQIQARTTHSKDGHAYAYRCTLVELSCHTDA